MIEFFVFVLIGFVVFGGNVEVMNFDVVGDFGVDVMGVVFVCEKRFGGFFKGDF